MSQDFSNTFCSLTHYVGPFEILYRLIQFSEISDKSMRVCIVHDYADKYFRVRIFSDYAELEFKILGLLYILYICYPNFSNVNFTAIGVGIYVRKLINLAKLFYPFHKEGSKILRNCPFRKNNFPQNFDLKCVKVACWKQVHF